MTTQVVESYKCKFCNKEFRKLTSLSVHMCETKRRWAQENDTGVRLGLAAFLQFYIATQGSAKTKTYAEFVVSPYYSAFVKFGQYMVQIRVINSTAFTNYLLKNNRKLDQWTKEIYYDEFLVEYLRKEHPNDALERSLTEMQRYADEAKINLDEVFIKGSSNKICSLIINGRVSPWVVYNCPSGIDFLSQLNDEQVALIYNFIVPDFWQRKLQDYVADSEFIKETLTLANL